MSEQKPDEKPEPLPPDVSARILACIGRLNFVFAKTMADIPHYYAVRGRPPSNEADWLTIAEALKQYGNLERWKDGRRYRYLRPGDGWKYWIIQRILNRARIELDTQLPGDDGPPSSV